jgi:hypothetical protein
LEDIAVQRLKGLDSDKMKNWVRRAEENQFVDPVYSFISAWIGFNYYYSTFAKANYSEFILWVDNCHPGKKGDRVEWLYLINHRDFIPFFNNYKKQYIKSFMEEIDLPIKSMLFGNEVPDGINGKRKFSDLTLDQIFSIIYQIRNNLFHGDKDPDKNKRDNQLSEIAGKFMVPLLNELIANTPVK